MEDFDLIEKSFLDFVKHYEEEYGSDPIDDDDVDPDFDLTDHLMRMF